MTKVTIVLLLNVLQHFIIKALTVLIFKILTKFNQSTASDNIQDSDKIFEQSTDVNETKVPHTSQNQITNKYTNKRDSVTGVNSDLNVTSIDIFREKGFSVDSVDEMQRNDENADR